MSETSDEELYERWRGGDQDAAAELSRRRLPGLRRLVHSMLTGDEAHDAIQEVFERLAKRASEGGEVKHVKAFVAGMARNVIRERLRRRRREAVDVTEQSLADISPNQSVEIQRKEEHRLLLKALHRMPVDDQMLIAMRYWERLRTKQLAEIFELKPSTLRTRLQRAEGRLQRLITELADSPEALESTMGSLTAWARERSS